MNLSGTLEAWDIKKLVPYEQNARNHPQSQIDKLAKSISQNGWDQPIVVDDQGVILKGHGRRLAALHLGLDKVPVLVRSDLTEKQKRAIRVSDNAISSLGLTDFDVLSKEINEMMKMDDPFEIDLSDMGLDGFNFDTSSLMQDVASYLPDSPTAPKDPGEKEAKDYSKPDLTQEKEAVSLFQCVVQCSGESEQKEVYDLVTQAGYTCRILTI